MLILEGAMDILEMAKEFAAREERIPTIDEAADLVWPERDGVAIGYGAVRVDAEQMVTHVWSMMDAERMVGLR